MKLPPLLRLQRPECEAISEREENLFLFLLFSLPMEDNALPSFSFLSLQNKRSLILSFFHYLLLLVFFCRNGVEGRQEMAVYHAFEEMMILSEGWFLLKIGKICFWYSNLERFFFFKVFPSNRRQVRLEILSSGKKMTSGSGFFFGIISCVDLSKVKTGFFPLLFS